MLLVNGEIGKSGGLGQFHSVGDVFADIGGVVGVRTEGYVSSAQLLEFFNHIKIGQGLSVCLTVAGGVYLKRLFVFGKQL